MPSPSNRCLICCRCCRVKQCPMTSSVLRIRRWKRSRSRAISSQTPLRQACRAKAHVCMIWTWITGEKCTFLDRGLTSRFNIGVVVHVCLVIRCESCGSLHRVWFFLLLVWSVFKFTDPSIFCMKIWNCYYVSHWPSHSVWLVCLAPYWWNVRLFQFVTAIKGCWICSSGRSISFETFHRSSRSVWLYLCTFKCLLTCNVEKPLGSSYPYC